MIQSVTFELKPCVMIVTPAAATEPVEQSASTSATKRRRNRGLNADAALTIADGCIRTGEGNREKRGATNGQDLLERIFSAQISHSSAYRFFIMNHPDYEGQPTSVPENTRELDVGEKIENGDLKWHQSASEWVEIQTLGYRIVKASQKGLFRRYSI